MQRKVKTIALQLGVYALFLAVLLMPLAGQVEAADTSWTGSAGDGLWSTGGNWNFRVPEMGDSAYLTNGDTIIYDTLLNPALHYVELESATLSQNQGKLTIGTTTYAPGNGFFIGSGGQYTLSGTGVLSMPTNGGNLFSIYGGFTQHGGEATVDITSVDGLYTQNGGTYKTGDFYVWGQHAMYGGSSDAAVILVNDIGVVNNYGGTQTANVLYIADRNGDGGIYNLYDGTLVTGGSVVGELYSGAVFNQGDIDPGTGLPTSGGTHRVNGDLILGNLAYMDEGTLYRGEGTYNLYNGDLTVTGIAKIGNEGIGYFNHTGGNFYANEVWIGVGDNSSYGSYGEYNLSGTGYLQANYLIIGGKDYINLPGVGVFNQNGGSVQAGGLWVADTAGSVGTYNLYSGDLTVNAYNVIGMRGTGTFNQYGGMHKANYILELGGTPTGTGTYNLVAGELVVSGGAGTRLGENGVGVFNQSGGTHTTNGLVLGQSGSGTYNLSGDGSILSVLNNGDIYLAVDGTGLFTQYDNSSVAANNLFIGSSTGSGTYKLYGGTLTLAGTTNIGCKGTGTFIQDGGTHTVAGDLGTGQGNSSNGYYELNGGMLSVGGAERIGVSGTGMFKQTGGSHKIGIDLVLANNTGSTGSYNLQGGELKVGFDPAGNPTEAYTFVGMNGIGTFTQTGGTHTISGGLTLGQEAGGQGIYNLNTGTSGEPNNGSLSVGNHEHIGFAGKGTFTQGAGIHTIAGDLVLGNDATGEGTFNLNGGTVSVASSVYVGWDGSGLFNQSGGDVTTRDLFLGFGTSGNGTYIMGGTSSLVIGDSVSMNGWFDVASTGKGLFQQQNGSVTVNGDMFVGSGTGGEGTYELKGGTLEVKGSEVKIGGSGMGTFKQTGGEYIFAGAMYLGDQATAKGTYYMQGGKLSGGGIALGEWGGKGEFYHSAGKVNVSNALELARQNNSYGYYELSSIGELYTKDTKVGGDGDGHFKQTGGAHYVSDTLTVAAGSGTGRYDFLGGSLSAAIIYVNPGGLFSGIGTINEFTAPVNFINKGTVAPGSSPGTLTIAGNYTQDVLGILEIELGGKGAGEYDVLNITEEATLGGTLKLLLYGTSYTPTTGDTFDILFAKAISGGFTLDGSATRWIWGIEYGDFITDNGLIEARITAQAPVPIPPTVWLLGAGLVGLIGLRRRLKG